MKKLPTTVWSRRVKRVSTNTSHALLACTALVASFLGLSVSLCRSNCVCPVHNACDNPLHPVYASLALFDSPALT